tara:strand:- start:325 stop:657 length:333 start_codon:yes stop_codon:yes gene_type:complete
MLSFSKTFVGVFLFAIAIVILVLFLDNQSWKRDFERLKEENEIEKQFDSIENKEVISEKAREVIKKDIEELEQEKDKPYGKKDYSNNKSAIRAERYFSERYNSKDSAKDR